MLLIEYWDRQLKVCVWGGIWAMCAALFCYARFECLRALPAPTPPLSGLRRGQDCTEY